MVKLEIPTHEEVAGVLDKSHPKIAKMIREEPKKNCWGDLILKIQHEFGPHYVATCFRRLSLKGWDRHISLTWCPITDPLWKQYEKSQRIVKDSSKLSEREKKMRTRTIYGAIALVRDLWKRTRNEWMSRWSLKNEDDPSFFNMIILYLERLAEEIDNAENIG